MRDPKETVSTVSEVNSFSVVTTYPNIRSKLKKYFTDDQLKLIEIAFECGSGNHGVNSSRTMDAKRFGKQFPRKDLRLQAIMLNIIQNEGTFNPPRLSQ